MSYRADIELNNTEEVSSTNSNRWLCADVSYGM